jgi:hypothetical protein
MPKVPIENTSLILKKTLAAAHLLPSPPGINGSPPPLLVAPPAGVGKENCAFVNLSTEGVSLQQRIYFTSTHRKFLHRNSFIQMGATGNIT